MEDGEIQMQVHKGIPRRLCASMFLACRVSEFGRDWCGLSKPFTRGLERSNRVSTTSRRMEYGVWGMGQASSVTAS